jgi:glycosyltransferase involved in cell wall biosynthesis
MHPLSSHSNSIRLYIREEIFCLSEINIKKIFQKKNKKIRNAFEKSLQIKLVGKVDIFVKEQIAAYGLTAYLHQIAYLPHDEVIKEQQRSKVLLLLVNRTKNAKGILTGKIFEYMASQTPIIAIGPIDGDLAAIINKTESGLISDFDDEEQLEKNILYYFENNFPNQNKQEVNKFSRKELTGQLCKLLNGL